MLFNSLYLNFENANWVFNNKKIKMSNLSSIASVVSDEVFHATPIIQNELVVRDKLSAMSMGGATTLFKKYLIQVILKTLVWKVIHQNLVFIYH